MIDMISFLTVATSRHFFVLFYGNGMAVGAVRIINEKMN